MRPFIDAVLFAKMLRFPVVTDEGAQYRDYLINLVADLERPAENVPPPEPQPAERGPGRPIKYGHPAYSEAEFKSVRDTIMGDISLYPHYYVAKNGKEAKGLAKEQPDDETIFVLDNGVELHYAGRATETEYPPVIFGGKE